MRSLKVLVYEAEDLPPGTWDPVIRCLCGSKEGDTPIGVRPGKSRNYVAGECFTLTSSFGFAYENAFEDIVFEVLDASSRELIALGGLNDIGKYVNAEKDSYFNLWVPVEPQGRLKIGLHLVTFPIDENRPDRCDIHISMLQDCDRVGPEDELRCLVKIGDTQFESTPVVAQRLQDRTVHQISQKFRFPYDLQRECHIIVQRGNEMVGNSVLDLWELLCRWKLPAVSHGGQTPLIDASHHHIGTVFAGVELWDGRNCGERLNRHLGPLDELELRMAEIAALDAECTARCPEDPAVKERVELSEASLVKGGENVAQCRRIAEEALMGDALSRSGVSAAEASIKRSRRAAEADINVAAVEALAAFRVAVQKEWVIGKAAEANVDKCCAVSARGLKDLPHSERVAGLLQAIERVELEAAKYGEQLDRALNASKIIQLPIVGRATLEEATKARIELEKLQIEAEKLEISAVEVVKAYRLERRRAENAGMRAMEPLLEGAPPVTPCCWICYC